MVAWRPIDTVPSLERDAAANRASSGVGRLDAAKNVAGQLPWRNASFVELYVREPPGPTDGPPSCC